MSEFTPTKKVPVAKEDESKALKSSEMIRSNMQTADKNVGDELLLYLIKK